MPFMLTARSVCGCIRSDVNEVCEVVLLCPADAALKVRSRGEDEAGDPVV
jgi:hypothetical protein